VWLAYFFSFFLAIFQYGTPNWPIEYLSLRALRAVTPPLLPVD
jgi:hypothetical protein